MGDPSQQWAAQQGYAAGGLPQQAMGYGAPAGYEQKSKVVAGLLGLLVPFGVHSFYLGDTTKGIIQLVVTIVTCGLGAIWSWIEGILILVGNIKTDANGVPLKD